MRLWQAIFCCWWLEAYHDWLILSAMRKNQVVLESSIVQNQLLMWLLNLRQLLTKRKMTIALRKLAEEKILPSGCILIRIQDKC